MSPIRYYSVVLCSATTLLWAPGVSCRQCLIGVSVCPSVCSYPALLPLPCHISDMSAAKVARCHRHGRLPVATWKHPRTRALLLRGSAFYGKGVRGIIMAHQATSE